MKSLKKCLVLTACFIMAATALTSCLDSDGDDNYIVPRLMTDLEKAEYLNEISGIYSGTMKYTHSDNKTGKGGVDSVEVNWIVRQDKTIEIVDLPDSIFRHYMSSNSTSKAVADTVTTTNSLELNMDAFFIEVDNSGIVLSKAFYLNAEKEPYSFELTRNDDDGTADTYPVEVNFANNYSVGMYSYSSMGVYDSKKKKITVQLILSGVKTESNIKANEIFLLSGTKK